MLTSKQSHRRYEREGGRGEKTRGQKTDSYDTLQQRVEAITRGPSPAVGVQWLKHGHWQLWQGPDACIHWIWLRYLSIYHDVNLVLLLVSHGQLFHDMHTFSQLMQKGKEQKKDGFCFCLHQWLAANFISSLKPLTIPNPFSWWYTENFNSGNPNARCTYVEKESIIAG